jgi:hypothetical protein
MYNNTWRCWPPFTSWISLVISGRLFRQPGINLTIPWTTPPPPSSIRSTWTCFLYGMWYLFHICTCVQCNIGLHKFLGKHKGRNAWSIMSDWIWYQNLQNQTEKGESDIRSDIVLNFLPICNIWFLNLWETMFIYVFVSMRVSVSMYLSLSFSMSMISLMIMKHEHEQIWKTIFLPIDIGSLDTGLARHWNRLKCLYCGGLRHFS